MEAARELMEYTGEEGAGGNSNRLDSYRGFLRGRGPSRSPSTKSNMEGLRERVGRLVRERVGRLVYEVTDLIQQRHGIRDVDLSSERPWT